MSDVDPRESELADDGCDLFDDIDPDVEEAALQRAEAQAAAGKGVPHEDVVAWLRTWGTPEEGPPPAHWFE